MNTLSIHLRSDSIAATLDHVDPMGNKKSRPVFAAYTGDNFHPSQLLGQQPIRDLNVCWIDVGLAAQYLPTLMELPVGAIDYQSPDSFVLASACDWMMAN